MAPCECWRFRDWSSTMRSSRAAPSKLCSPVMMRSCFGPRFILVCDWIFSTISKISGAGSSMLLGFCGREDTTFTIHASAYPCFTITFLASGPIKMKTGAGQHHSIRSDPTRTFPVVRHSLCSIFEIRRVENAFFASTCQPQLDVTEQCEEMFNCIDFVEFDEAHLCAK